MIKHLITDYMEDNTQTIDEIVKMKNKLLNDIRELCEEFTRQTGTYPQITVSNQIIERGCGRVIGVTEVEGEIKL